MKSVNPILLEFPECTGKDTFGSTPQINSISTLWGDLTMTPFSQQVVFKTAAAGKFIEGDLIGAVGPDNQLYGFMEAAANGTNQAIALFGSDPASYPQNGFAEGQDVIYKLFRTSTGEVFELQVEYDQTMDNATGKYYSNSFAAIVNVSMQLTGMDEIAKSRLSMYPNPATEAVYFSFDGAAHEQITILIYDAKGQVVASERFTQNLRLNTSSLDAGVYFVKISTQTHTEVRKLIIQ